MTTWSKTSGQNFTPFAHIYAGLTTIRLLKYLSWTIPAVISGVFSGSLIYRRFKTREYIRIFLVVLILMGVMMIRSALAV
ncbi:MAG: hypothetical protein KKB30_04545 [Proteobacteria bacterium]|nr:hypothetical protein [Pseudomonadota bacterium]MBU1715521.1 hypothetical protein [Pseudomonadota bacterium]